jgi:hypothetical protein
MSDDIDDCVRALIVKMASDEDFKKMLKCAMEITTESGKYVDSVKKSVTDSETVLSNVINEVSKKS